MSITVKINSEDVKNFSHNAKDELKKQLEEYCKNTIAEAERLGANFRVDERDVEITARIIQDAVQINKNPYIQTKKKKPSILYTLSVIGIFFAGLLFDLNEFQINIWQLIAFLVCSMIGMFATIALYFKEGE